METKYPSFKAQHGRLPIAGKDYEPDAAMCQDDYEYLSGTGRYSDEADIDVIYEHRFIRREIINEFLHAGYKTIGTIREAGRFQEVSRFGHTMQIYTQWDGWDYGGGVDDPRY